MKRQLSRFTPFSIMVCLILSALNLALASPPPLGENGVHFCGVTEWQPDNRRYARSFAANLNVGEPRTVRMIYFLPNDRPYRAEVVQHMKDEIRSIQTFYAEQMEVHGYGQGTFRIETDAQGQPIVHRMDGQHPDSHYLNDTLGSVIDEVQSTFDLSANIYLTVIDNSADLIIDMSSGKDGQGRGERIQKNGGYALVSGGFGFNVTAHELGHAFGLRHDYRDRVYLMSYGGSSQPRLSACNAEFLSVHPYFNAAIPIEEGSLPTIELISSLKYPAGSNSVFVQLKLSDAEGLHQVFLLAEERGGGYYEVWECRGAAGRKDDEVEFNYDGYSPSHADWGRIRRLSDQDEYQIAVMAIDMAGNVNTRHFELSEEYTPEGRRASTIEIITGDNQQDVSRALLPTPLVVEVRDQHGQPLPDALIQFGVIEGDARLSGKFYVANTMTNAYGRAEQTLTLGSNPGTNIIRVSAPNAPECQPVTFSAIAVGVPAVPIMDGDSQTWSLPNGAATRLGNGSINDQTDRTVSFSPDGQHVAVASGIGIWLYDTATLRESALLEHRSPVLSVSFSRNGSMLASGLKDGTVHLWDVTTRRNVATFEGHISWVTSVSFSSDGTKLVSGDHWQTVKLWEVVTTRNIATWTANRVDNRSAPISVALSPDGTMLAAGFVDKTLRLWNVATKENFAYLEGHRLHVRSVAFSPDGKMLASGSDDANVKLWNVVSKQNIATLKAHSGPVTSVAFSLDGSTLASGSRDSTVELWDVATKDNVASLVGGHTSWVTSVSLSPSGKVIASASVDGTIGLWDVETGNATTFLGLGHVDVGASVSFSRDGKVLATGAEDGTVKLWEVETGRNTKSLGLRPYGIDVVSFSPDGTTLAAGSLDNTIDLWNVTTDTKIASFKRGKGQILSLAFSPDGTTLAAGDPAGVVLWDMATRTYISTPLGHANWVWSVSFSRDEALIVSGSGDGTLALWNVPTLTHIATLTASTGGLVYVSLSPNGRILASASSYGTLQLWDMATREVSPTLISEMHSSAFHSISFSRDGMLLATGSTDGKVRLWDVAKRADIVTLEGHTDTVTSVAFSSDGTTLASGSEDGTVLLWDLQLPQLQSPTLAIISGDDQQGLPGTALEKPFVVEVRGQFDKPLPGAKVTFSVTSGGGTLSATSATTDSNGWAESTLTLGPNPGTNTVIVSITGSQETRTFNAEGNRIPKKLEIISGVDQEGLPGDVLEKPFVVEVRDQTDKPLAGVEVTFTVASGGGMLSATSATTDSNGWAESTLTLGPNAGTNTVTVSVAGLQEVQTFNAEGIRIPKTLEIISGVDQEGLPGDVLEKPFVVEVRDQTDKPLPGVEVTFSITSGDGTLSEISVTTDSNGRAESTLTLGPNPGTNTVTVSVTGSQETRTFNAEASRIPKKLEIISGVDQEGLPGDVLEKPFVVEVRDQTDKPLPSVEVTFTVTAGGGTLSATSATTDSNGRAESTLILGPNPGTNTVTVSVTGSQETRTFNAEASRIPKKLEIISGVDQEGLPGDALEKAFVVEVRDQTDTPLPGVEVTFTVTAGGGTVQPEIATTDENGRAESTLTLGSTPGTNTVRVSVEGNTQAVATLTIETVRMFALSIPAGTHLIHIPLAVNQINGEDASIDTVGDLYNTLGDAVSYIITVGDDGGWKTYLGNLSAGSAADAAIGDDTGLIVVMSDAKTLELAGDMLGTAGASQINIDVGNNLVGLPLKPAAGLSMISDLLVDGVGAIAVSKADGMGFHTIRKPGQDGDAPIVGGVGYLVVYIGTEATSIPIVGSAWENSGAVSAAPAVAFDGTHTPVLYVEGGVMDDYDMLSRIPELRVTVKNLSTGASLDTVLGTELSATAYSGTFVELSRHAAKVGDVLEIVAHSPNPFVGVRPVPQIVVSAEQVLTSRISLPDLELYEIPSETELLANYPNPFNPETWIPYRLAKAAGVTLDIYDTNGRLVRTIDVGFKPAAVYESRASAIYWDGRNNYGERVASGTYFYHLSAGDYSATRKMLVLK